MAKVVTTGVKTVSFSPIDGAESWTEIGQIVGGSLSISQESDTRTDVESELDDVPLVSVLKKGNFTIAFDVAGLDPELVKELTGASGTGTTVSLSGDAKYIFKKIKVEFGNGISSILFHKAQISANANGSTLKTNAFVYQVQALALKDDTGKYIDLVFPA